MEIKIYVWAYSYLVTSKIDFDIVAVDVELLIGVVEHGRRTRITWIAGHVVGHH